jgi:hypothetical protein
VVDTKIYLLEHNVLQSIEINRHFRGFFHVYLQYRILDFAFYVLLIGLLLGFLFSPEDTGSISLRNISNIHSAWPYIVENGILLFCLREDLRFCKDKFI